MQSPILGFRYDSNQKFTIPDNIPNSSNVHYEKVILQNFQNANNFNELNVSIFSPELKCLVNGYLNKKLNYNSQSNPTKKTINMNSNIKTTFKINNSRVLFKKEEDDRIIELVKIFGNKQWNIISYFMDGRTPKQCRDRYSNYLIPGFFQGEWTNEEDALLIKLYNQYGSKWSIIQKLFHNRSANNIKNRWYYFLKKRIQKSKNEIKTEVNDKFNQKEYKYNKEDKQLNLDENDILDQCENEMFDLFTTDPYNAWMLGNSD